MCVCVHALHSICFETQLCQIYSHRFMFTTVEASSLAQWTTHRNSAATSTIAGWWTHLPLVLQLCVRLDPSKPGRGRGAEKPCGHGAMLVDFFSEGVCFKNQANALSSSIKLPKGSPWLPLPLSQGSLVGQVHFGKSQLPPGQLGECQQISHAFKYVRGNPTFSHHFKNPSDRWMKWDNWASGHIWVNWADRRREPCPPLAAVKTNRNENSRRSCEGPLGVPACFESTVRMPGQ